MLDKPFHAMEDVTNINCVGGIGFLDMSVGNQVSQVCMDDEIGCSANF
jgi:hypothetical protein